MTRTVRTTCYAIAGPKNSNYRRYPVGEPLWRLLAQMPAAAAWFNDFVASDTEASITKGESFYIIAVKAGPHAVPYMGHKELKRDYGFIGVRSVEQASDFTPDFEVYAHDGSRAAQEHLRRNAMVVELIWSERFRLCLTSLCERSLLVQEMGVKPRYVLTIHVWVIFVPLGC